MQISNNATTLVSSPSKFRTSNLKIAAKTCLVTGVLLTTAGCETVWTHNDPQMLTQFSYADSVCNQRAAKLTQAQYNGNAFLDDLSRMSWYQDCMQNKGYYQVSR